MERKDRFATTIKNAQQTLSKTIGTKKEAQMWLFKIENGVFREKK